MSTVGIIAGRGDLPFLILEALKSQEDDVFVLAVKGDTKPELVENTAHQWIEMAEISQTLDIMREQGVKDIVMAGGLSRPPIKALTPSPLTTKILKRMGAAFFRGDDALFKAIITIFEEEGFNVLGADEVLKDILTPKGVLTQTQPINGDDITLAINAAKELGEKDIGQAVIVQNSEVIAEEDANGTDALIEKTGEAKGAILAKTKKPKQERRVDLPTIGPDTIEALAAHGYAGVALEADHSLILHRSQVIELADKHGLFVIGV